ncbi:MAG: SPFH domain-containing protein, partial [Pseudomonadota bacterium]
MPIKFSPFLIISALLGLFLIYNAAYMVKQTETALVTQFGEPVAIETTPGLKFRKPFMQTVEYFDKRLLEYSMPNEIEINASDEKRIKLEAFVRWRIIDPLAFARATRAAGIGGNRVSTMNLQIANLLGSSLRQVIGSVPLNALLSPERENIMLKIKEQLAKQSNVSNNPDVNETEEASKIKTKSGFGIE